MYFKTNNGHILIIVLYVDDMLFIGNGQGIISDLKSQLSAPFKMKYLGTMMYILEIKIMRD